MLTKNVQTGEVLRSVREAILLLGNDIPKLTLSEALAIEHHGKILAALITAAEARLYPPCAVCDKIPLPGYADETLCADGRTRLVCHDCLANVPEPGTAGQ
jgi:hypothetical protein